MKEFGLNTLLIKSLSFSVLFAISLLIGMKMIALSTQYTEIFEKYTFGNTDSNGFTHNRTLDFSNWISKKGKKGLILGSSTAYRNIDPTILSSNDMEWFNLGSSLQTPDISLILLEHMLNKYKVEAVLFDYYPDIIEYNNFESTMDLIKNGNLSTQLKYQLAKNCRFNVEVFLQMIYRFIKTETKSKVIQKNENWSGEYQSNGFVAMNNIQSLIGNKIDFKTDTIEITTQIKEIAKICRNHDTKIIFNIPPHVEKRFVLTSNWADYKFVNSTSFTQSPENIQHFYDSHHMTSKGAKCYTHQLKQNLISLQYLTPEFPNNTSH